MAAGKRDRVDRTRMGGKPGGRASGAGSARLDWDRLWTIGREGLFIVLIASFLYLYAGLAQDIVQRLGQPYALAMEGPYDWADTAAFCVMMQQGYWTQAPEMFIAGGQIAGLFPPAFMWLANGMDALLGNLDLTFLLLSAMMQLPLLYYAVRKWKRPWQRLLVLLLLAWSALTWHYFPLTMRLREQLAILGLVLLFENPLRLDKRLHYLLMGALMILSQPMVAVAGLVLYPILQADGRWERLDRRYLGMLALLALFFIGVYGEHFRIKGQGLTPAGSVGFAQLTIDMAAPANLPTVLLLLACPAAFFLTYSRTDVRWMWGLYLLGLAALFGLAYWPSGFMRLIGPFAEDFNPLFYVMFVLGALHPGPQADGAGADRAAWTLVMAYLCISLVFWPTRMGAAESDHLQGLPSGTRVLATSVFLWEGPREVHFKSFDFHLMSEIYLRGLPLRVHYSPMQQFYDTQGLWPDTQMIIQSIDSGDWAACRAARGRLSGQVDLLTLGVVSRVGEDTPWSARLWERMTDPTIVAECGLSIPTPGHETSVPYVYYRLNETAGPEDGDGSGEAQRAAERGERQDRAG